MEELDGDLAADHRVLGHVDRAHAALAQGLENPVAADAPPDELVNFLSRYAGFRRQLFLVDLGRHVESTSQKATRSVNPFDGGRGQLEVVPSPAPACGT